MKFSFSLPDMNGLLLALRNWRKRSIFKAGRLSYYRDCLDSKLDLREFTTFRAEQLERREDPMFPPVLMILRNLQTGATVGNSLRGIAPDVDVALIAAYEKNNRLSEGLRAAISIAVEQRELKRLLRKSVVGPLSYMGLAVALVMFGIPMLLEELGPMLPIESRTVDQIVLIWFANFMSSWGGLISLIALGGLAIGVISLPKWTGPFRRKLDQSFVPMKMYKAYHSAIFLKTMAVQLSVTPKMEEALGHIWTNSSNWQRMYVEMIQARLPHNRINPLQAFDVGFLDVHMIDSLSIISRKGTAEEAIMVRAEEAGTAAVESIESGIAWMKTISTLAAGLVIAWTAYSFVLGMVKVTMQGMSDISQPRNLR